MQYRRGRGVHAWLKAAFWLAVFSLLAASSPAQQNAARITKPIDDSDRTAIAGTHPPMAKAESDSGRVPAETKLQGINIVFSRTPAQEADLQALIAAQQDPASPSYHHWLTPEEFAARFGAADSDIAQVRSWLDQHGFIVESVSRSKTRISFSGTIGQVESAFGTEIHTYDISGETHFAPAADISIPAALAPVVQTVTNLSTFRPRPRVIRKGPLVVNPDFTSSVSGAHYLTPKDVATIYNINPAYSAGYNGAGQSIAVVGQSAIVLTDIENFQKAAGFTVKDPTLDLVPSTGAAAVRTGDEAESDLDLEYTSTIASGATIHFVFAGNNANAGVLDAVQYAIDQKTYPVFPVISISYGLCETALGSAGYASYDGILKQAATQGQSVIVSSGDNGSTDCYGEPGLSTAQQEALAVDFPASSEYVTGMGGTEFPSADVAASNTTYWQAASGSDVISSALSYIPEQVWNDDTATGNKANLASGGGGISIFTPRPSWQSGVPGISSGGFRLVPDLSLSSSPQNAGYLFCTSDTSFSGVTGSCSNGFRDSAGTALTVAGGTSFAAPIFAGMLAIINDRLNSPGQGVINPILYTLAANPTTYSSAFHDITSGGNQCNLGMSFCSAKGASEYSASTGYDMASGLGSVDFFNLMSAWPGVSTLVNSKTTLSPATATPAPGASDLISITVASASASSTTTPTGTLAVTVDGVTKASSLALVNGSATYTFSSATLGSHAIAATYSGDSTYATSKGSLTVTVTAVAPPVANAQSVTTAANTPKAITLTGTPHTAGDTLTYSIVTTPAHGTLSGSAPNVTYTPASGYSGADSFTFDVTENGVRSSPATVSITVTAPPPAPVAHNQSVTTNQNTAVAITLSGTPGTAGDTLTFAIAANPSHGTLSGTPPAVTYTPSTGYTGADSFTFNVTESNGAKSSTPGTVAITVVQPAPKAFALAAANLTVAAGSSGTSTVSVTPQNGYSGTISWAVTASPALSAGCFSLPNTTVSGAGAVTATLTVYTAASSCPAPAIKAESGRRGNTTSFNLGGMNSSRFPQSATRGAAVSLAILGLLLFWSLGDYSRKVGKLGAICVLAAIGFGISGCAGAGVSSAPPAATTAAKGTYTVTVVGTDTTSKSITTSTSLTLIIN